MKNLSDYIQNGMVITGKSDNYDGGDSCAYGMSILYASKVKNLNAEKLIGCGIGYTTALEKEPGRYCRNPDPSKWYSSIETLSRDQFIPLLIFLGYARLTAFRNRLFIAHLKHLLLFAWNTRMNGAYPGTPAYAWKIPDVTFFDCLSLWIRAYRFWPFYPLLLILDLQSLIGVLLYRFEIVQTTLQTNQILMADYAYRCMPTPISLLTILLYGRVMPIQALDLTFDPDWQPPVNEYVEVLVKSWPMV